MQLLYRSLLSFRSKLGGLDEYMGAGSRTGSRTGGGIEAFGVSKSRIRGWSPT